MNRQSILSLIAMFAVSLSFGAVHNAVKMGAAGESWADSVADIGNVRLKGYLGERLEAMIANHVAAQDVDYITAPFMEKTETKGCWQTEFWGKWMHSVVPYLRYVTNVKWKM